ncbi:MAG: ABC transporter ATP-binding protein [Spongiibacteraceae bacterium]
MSSDGIAIQVNDLSKCYAIYDQPRDRLKQFVLPKLGRLIGRDSQAYYREFWALKNISFNVHKGETVGIIGRNGSGKSTLLQLICGTLNPTSGSLQTQGRIAALLELGSGFNPEFTGRENVYMNGSILGLTAQEIDARFDDIAAFADIGEFINQPVKTYSSGMVVRLAFAVAINVDPQILVVDEALSVGDELFQRKCFARISQIKERGATILFVSHSGSAVVELCDRAILLDSAELLCSGSPKSIVGKYQKLIYAPNEQRLHIRAEIRSCAEYSGTDKNEDQQVPAENPAPCVELESFYDPHLISQSILSYAPQGACIEETKILTMEGKQVNCLRRGETYRYTYSVRFLSAATNVRFGMLIKSITGLELGGAETKPITGEHNTYISAGTKIAIEFKFKCLMNPGAYFLNAGVLGMRNEVDTYLHRILDAVMLKVMPMQNDIATALIDLECTPQFFILNSIDHETSV